jgi:hypothetical protein
LAQDASHDARILTLLASVLNSDDEPLPVRESAAQAIGDFGNPEALKALTPVAEAHAHDDLGFWAAVSAVKLADGAIRNVGVVRALKNYRPPIEGSSFDEDQRELRNALEKITEHGATWRVRLAVRDLDWLLIAIPAAITLLVVAIVIVWFVMRKKGIREGILREIEAKESNGQVQTN